MRRFRFLAPIVVAAAALVGSAAAGEPVTRTYSVAASYAATTTAPPPVTQVAFGHRRHHGCSNCGTGFATAYSAYGTYQPAVYAAGYYGVPYPANYGSLLALGYYGGPNAYVAGYSGAYVYSTPNPYGYYPNGAIWGSSGPWYGRPFAVWGSPSGYYGYRYNGWGSYGWGGWGGTGPAGWGYQGGFYW